MPDLTAAAWLSPQTLVPDLLERRPEARPVLDRYGLRGCGGRRGPHESLAFFARMHGVAEATLLDELREAIAAPGSGRGNASGGAVALPIADAPSVADTIYRRYFIAGIVAVLTVGAGWGVWLLWQIGFAASFTGVSIHDVNAHGHAQIAGWVGLFIMGFAYQALPRFWHTSLAAPRLAVAVFIATLVGLVVRTTGMWWHATAWGVPAAMTGGALELAAILAFAGQLVVTWRRSEARFEPYLLFVFAALAFFPIQAAMELWHTWNTMTAGSRDELLWYVATYQAVLRDLQIHGLALFMILGVSLRILPGMLGLPAVSSRRVVMAWGLLLAAVVGEVVLFLAYRWTGRHVLAAGLLVPWLMLAVGSLLIPWGWRLWRAEPSSELVSNRSGKFIRAAYGWLALSMAMLLLLPVYQAVAGVPFSHAYYGAIRHAITVGFISLMIMGTAAKVVPTLSGVDPRGLTRLVGPFVLVNLGCALRVSLQTLTDWHPSFYAVVGVSGLLELAGLTWWGLHLLRVMRQGQREAMTDGAMPPAPPPAPPPETIEAGHTPAEVLAWFPRTQEVFDRFGFGALRNPVLRRTVARQTTLARAAAMRNVPLADLLAALNEAVGLIDALREEPMACDHGCGTCDHAHAPSA